MTSRRVQLVLSNESPTVPVSRAFLFCHTPGFVSFGRAGREQTQRRRGALFQHPVIDEDCLAATSDSGLELRTRLDMLPVPLESELRDSIQFQFDLSFDLINGFRFLIESVLVTNGRMV